MAVTLPAGPKLEDSLARVQWAVANGYDDAWFADGGAPDSLTFAAGLEPHTGTLRIGVAVTPVFTRTPAVLAATAHALGQLLPGRFIMGLGASSQTMMDGWHGVPMQQPLTRVKETAIMVRSMLAGNKSDFELNTLRSKGYRQPPLAEPVPKMMEHVRIGAAKAGKDPASVEVVNRYMVLVTEDKSAGLARFKAMMAPYYATPVYNKFLAWAGYEEVAQTIADGWAQRDRAKTTGAISDELANDIAVIGTADECRDRIGWAAEIGVHTHIIAPLSDDPAEIECTFAAFTPHQFHL